EGLHARHPRRPRDVGRRRTRAGAGRARCSAGGRVV
ncbi:MAG: hypothetical protein AVDCRST_MAG16-1109, partial [uncultured Frankineae bacterium]